MTSVPASYFSAVNPGVLQAGGTGLALVGLMLTSGTRVPIGTVLSLSSLTAVGNYFGVSSTEYAAASVYFNSFNNSDIKPGSILYAQYPTAAVAAYLRGGNVGAALTLAQLQALTPAPLTITSNGTPLTSTNINLSTATSFSNAATIIQAAFTTPPFTVTYDSIAGAFVFTNTLTGVTSTQAFATNTMAAPLLLTSATGAVLSQGAATATPAAFMAGIVAQTTNWATFCTLFNPDVSGNANKLAFAQWNATQNDAYTYVCWDTDVTPTTTVPATTSLGYLIGASGLNIDGTCLVYDPSNTYLAALVCGIVASIDFTKTNGNVNPTFKSQTGFAATVSQQQILANLQANGYNCYVAAATANQAFNFFWNGQVSGRWLWLQPYINQIWMSASFQMDGMGLLTNAKSIPYNATGKAMVAQAYMNTINNALNFGAIQSGVQLSAQEIIQVNNAAGKQIDTILSTRGWYLSVGDSSPTTRQARSTPPCTFWYTDGGSVQQLTLASYDLL